MNRRNFLKSIATVCGTAVVCPGELLKTSVEFRPNPVQKIIGERVKLPWKHFYTTYYYNRDMIMRAYQGQYYETTQT